MSVRTGLIGYGLAGYAFHAPMIAGVARLDLKAIATTRREQVAADWPDAYVVDAQAILDDPAIELVVVATPNDSHEPLARAALERGKHVVIDKPFAPSAAAGEGLVALAAAKGRMVTVFHNRRWDGDFMTVRKLIEEGRLGEVRLYEARWDRFRPGLRGSWHETESDGNGVIVDLGPHLVDQALQLFGMPEALSADLAIQRDGSVVNDYFEMTLHYGRARAILSCGSFMRVPRARFAIHGTGGSFYKHGIDPQEAVLRAGEGRPGDPGFGEEPEAAWGVLTTDEGSAKIETARGDYRLFYEGVADAILNGAPPPVDPIDAVTGLRLIELARQSSAEGRVMRV